MRSKVVRTLALAIMLSGMSIVLGQQNPQHPGVPDKGGKDSPGWGKGGFAGKLPEQKSPPEKSKLEGMLLEALKNNPDIRVAAAKLAEAEAELNRTRLQVTQKVVTLYYAIETQKKTIEHEEAKFKARERSYKSGSLPVEMLTDSRQTLALAKAKLEELEAPMPALLGKSVHSEANAEALQTSAALTLRLIAQPQDTNELAKYHHSMLALAGFANQHKAAGPMAERLRKALQTPVKVKYHSVPLSDVFKDLEKKVSGLSLRGTSQVSGWTVQDMQFEEALPVSAILQALADDWELRFIIREYGILAIHGAMPPGGLTVEDFLRHKPADESRPQSRGGKNPPAENVEGLVKTVDASGLMKLTIGSDAGLTKGHTLELFRLNPSTPSESKYLGTVRILEAEARQSVAQPVGRLSSPPQRGDRVASRMLGN